MFDWAYNFKNSRHFGKEISISFSYYNPCSGCYLLTSLGNIFFFAEKAIPEYQLL